MLRTGRDPRSKLLLGVKALASCLVQLVGAFIAFSKLVITGVNTKVATSTLRRKGAVLVTVCLLIPLSVLIPAFVTTPKVNAATSSTLNFQGRLLSNTGSLVADGTYNMQFNLYTVSSGGTTQWTESYLVNATQGVTIKSGYFSVNLGSITSFPSTINWDQEQWLGMTVRGTNSCTPFSSCATPADSEMTPRFKLTAVPYAFVAGSALGVTSNNTNAASTNSNAVTIKTGNATGTTSNSGNLTIDTGTATQTTGTITIGATSASALTLGRSGLTTTNSGALTVSQLLTGNAGITTSGGAVSLSGNAASSLTTSSGALTLTSAAAATWSTTAGNLTIQGGSGTVSLGSTTTLNATGALTISSGGASALTLDSASNTLVIAATDTTLQRTAVGTTTLNLVDGANTTLAVTNSGAGVANLTVDGSITAATGLTVSANGIAVTGNSTITGTLGSLTGLTSSGTVTFSGLSTAGIVTNTAGGVLGTTGTLGVTLGGTGTSTAFTQGSVLFAGASGVYSQDNTNLFYDSANARLGVGTATTTGNRLTVNNNAVAENIFVAQDNGSTVFTIGDGGLVGSGLAPVTGRQMSVNGLLSISTAANARLQFVPTGGGTQNLWNIDNSAGSLRVFRENYSATGTGAGGVVRLQVNDSGATDGITTSFTATNTTDQTGTFSTLTVTPTASAGSSVYDGNYVLATGTSTAFMGSAYINGGHYIARWNGTSGNNLFEARGFASEAQNNSTGTIGEATGANVRVMNNSTGTISTAKGLYVLGLVNGGTVTNNYGIYIDNQTTGTNDYGIYVAGADTNALWIDAGATRLDGVTTIGTGLASGDALTVTNGTSTGNILVLQDNATTVLTVADGGSITFQNSVDSMTAFRLQNAAGVSLLNADTTNSLISINGEINTQYGGLGRYSNLLLYSENFDNAVSGATWTETNVTAPASNTIVAPDGQTTAESLVSTVAGGSDAQTSATAAGATYTFSVWLKSTGAVTGALRIDGATTGTGTAQSVNVTTAWQRFSVTQNTSGFTGNVKVLIFPGGTGGTGTVHAWGAQLVAGTSPGVYTPTMGVTTAATSGITTGGTITSAVAAGGFSLLNVNNNPSIGTSGLVIGSLTGSNSYARLRITGNTNAWADVQTTTYFQMSNTVNNNATFMGGTYGTDTQLNRLQFNALNTQFTDLVFTATPAPTALFEIISGNTTKVNLKVKAAAAQTAKLLDVQDSASATLFEVTAGGLAGVGGSSDGTRRLTINAAGAGRDYLAFAEAGVTKWHLVATVSGDLDFTESGVANNRLYLKAGGNVGIGDGSPAALLTVGSGDLFQVTSGGLVSMNSSANSTTQLEVRDGSSTTVTLLVADSTNDRIYVGDTTADATGALLVLDAKNTAGDPTGVNGGMYYNSSTNRFRCFQNAGWTDCIGGIGALTDNIADAFDLQEGTNNYININTTNGSENISLGNATTNPSFSLLGSGNLTVGGNILSANSATATTRTTEATARTNVTTVTITVAGFANNDIIFINNAGQDYYTRVVSGGGTTALTVSPAVSYDASVTVTLYQNVRNIGATNSDYTTQTNRFFQGYFLGGVVTGAGTTTLSDRNLTSTGELYLNTTGATNINGTGNTPLTVNTTATASYINFRTSGTSQGYFGYTSNGSGGLAAINAAGSTVNLLVTNAGYVGIGTVSPTQSLVLNQASSTNAIEFQTNATTRGYFGVSNSASGIINGSAVGDLMLRTQGSKLMISVDSGSTSTLTVESTSSVKIGGAAAGAIGALQLTTGGSSPISNRLQYGTDGTGWKFAISKNQGGTVTDQLTVADSGMVTVATKLQVASTASNAKLSIGAGSGTGCDQASYDVCAGIVAVNTSLYSYGAICAGNSSGDCTGTGGSYLSGSKIYFPNGTYGGAGANTPTLASVADTNTGFLMDSGTADSIRLITNGYDTFSCTYNTACSFGGGAGNATGTGSVNVVVGGKVAACTIGSGTGATNCTSDIRKKNTIQGTTGNLNKILNLNPVSFKWNSQGPNGPTRIGLIAQEVLPYFPEAVDVDEAGFYGLDYGVLVSPLIGAVKELNVKVEDTRARLAVLETGQFSGNLTVQGVATLNKLIVTGDTVVAKLTVSGKIITAGTAPTAAVGAVSGLGASVTATGNDTAGNIAFTTGTISLPANPLAAGEQINATFSSAYDVAPRIALTPKNDKAASVRYYVETSTTGFTIKFIDTPAQSVDYLFDYIIVQ